MTFDFRTITGRAVGCAILFPGFVFSACTPPEQNTDTSAAPISWLAGCWETDDAATTEAWHGAGEELMFGYGVTKQDGKPVFFEQLRIEVRDGGGALFAYPLGRGPTQFDLVSESEADVTFESPENDYPQRILYRTTEDGLEAVISLLDGSREKRWDYRPCKGGETP